MGVSMRIFLLLIMVFLLSKNLFSITAEEIISKIDKNLTFEEGQMSITIVDIKSNKEYKNMAAVVKFKRDYATLIEFLSPAREKGKKILMMNDNMWMYVPGVSKPVRLSGKDSFMGTSFSNRDLMDYDMANDYSARIIEEKEEVYILELIAKNKNVSYAKIILSVDKRLFLPVKEELYTVSGNLIKIMEFSKNKDFNGKVRPSEIFVKDFLTEGAMTKVFVNNMEEKKYEKTIFSPQNLSR